MNILHVAPDYKFLPFVAETFDAVSDVQNVCLIHGPYHANYPQYAGTSGAFRFIDDTYFGSDSMSEDLAWCDCLIVHFLDVHAAKMILNAPARVAVVWSGWGGDYYDLPFGSQRRFLSKETKALVGQLRASETAHLDVPRRILHRARRFKESFSGLRLRTKAIGSVDFFSAPIDDEYELVKTAVGRKFRAGYVQLNYASVEHTFIHGPAAVTGNDILVGNSATPTNNHSDVLRQLANLDLAGRKIIAPLSYGYPDYRDAIVRYGKEVLGARFQAIVDFIPLEAYNAMIANCSTVIMGHRRQQALGNICTLLYKGAKVFLSEQNVVYQFLKSRGAVVYGLRDLDALGGGGLEPLTEEQKRTNREVLEAHWGHRAVLRNTQNLVDSVRTRPIRAHAQY